MVLLIGSVVLGVRAHSGRTDGSGGHTDSDTGEYHYHHGYPAHQHYDIDGDGVVDCPYEFDDKTNHSGGGGFNDSSGNITENTEAGTENILPEQNEEVQEVPAWIYWALAIQFIVILVLYFANRRKRVDIERMTCEHKKNLEEMRQACNRTLKEKNATDNELQQIKSSVTQLKEEKEALQRVLARERMELAKTRTTRYRTKNAPLDITFAKDSMPIYWKPSVTKPYGDYTVYVNKNSKIYHVDYFCASIGSSRSHIFTVIQHARPCKKCAEGFFDFTEVPVWFLPKKVPEITAQKQQCSYLLDNITYETVAQQAFEMGVPFDTAQKIINAERKEIGLDPACFKEKPASMHPDEGIWDDPDERPCDIWFDEWPPPASK